MCRLLSDSLNPLDRILGQLSKTDCSKNSKFVIRKLEIILDKFLRFLHKRSKKAWVSKYWDPSKDRTKIKMHVGNLMLLLNEHHAIVLDEVQVDLKQLPEKIERSLEIISSQAVTDIKKCVEECKSEIIIAINRRYKSTSNLPRKSITNQEKIYPFERFYRYLCKKYFSISDKKLIKEDELKIALKYYFLLKDYDDANVQSLVDNQLNINKLFLETDQIKRFFIEVWEDPESKEKMVNDSIIIPELSKRNSLSYGFYLLSYSSSIRGSLTKGKFYEIKTKISREELNSSSISKTPLATVNYDNGWYITYTNNSRKNRIFYLLYNNLSISENLIFIISSFGNYYYFSVKLYRLDTVSYRKLKKEYRSFEKDNYELLINYKNQRFEIIGNMKLGINENNEIKFSLTNENPIFIKKNGSYYLCPSPDVEIWVDIYNGRTLGMYKINSSTALLIGNKKFKAILK